MKALQLILAIHISVASQAQSFTEVIRKEFKFEKQNAQNTFILANTNGDVTIEGYAGDKILIEAERTIKGKTEARLEKGKKEVQLYMT